MGPTDTSTESPPDTAQPVSEPSVSPERPRPDAEMDKAHGEILYGEVWNGLARLRRHVEKELRRLAPDTVTREAKDRAVPFGRLISSLRTIGTLPPEAAEHLQYAIQVANAAVHGRDVSVHLADAAWRSASIGLALARNDQGDDIADDERGAAYEEDRFATKALAESFRSQLISATRSGEPFDELTGLPESRAREVSWLDHAISYVDVKWPRAAAKSRKSTAEALTTVTLALVIGRRDRPAEPVLREALYGWAFNAGRRAAGEPSREIADALTWAGTSARPVSALRDLSVTRGVLDALAVRLDGRPAAATTVYRKRTVFYNALGLAVERRLLPTNPIDQVQWSAPEVAQAVDRRVVAGPEQVCGRCSMLCWKPVGAVITWWRSSAACTSPGCGPGRRWPCGRVSACCRRTAGVGLS